MSFCSKNYRELNKKLMPIFQIKNNKFTKIKERSFNYERDLQKLVEQNLEEIFGLEFVSGVSNKQFFLKNLEIDTLAFDSQARAFVIIEYKKNKSFSVIDQGYTYLALLLNNKAEFILHYNEIKNKNFGKNNIDWSQSRIIFVAREFTPYQKGAVGFRDLPIELWEVQLLEGGIISFSQIKPAETQESITKVTKSRIIKRVSQEVKTFTVEDHYQKASQKIKSLLDKLRERILVLDESIKEKPVQNYLGYKLNWYNFVSIHVYREKLKVYVRKKKLERDKEKKFTRVPASYEWGKTPLWWIDISESASLDYIMEVIKESYEAAPDH